MWRLIRKNSSMFLLYQVLYFGLFFPLINQDRLFSENPLDLSFLFYINTYMIWLILGSVWSQEQLEYKSNGYAFLRTLPIRGRQIVGAKYTLAFLATSSYVVVLLIWYALAFDDQAFLAAGRASLIHVASVCLFLSGLYYLGFFRFGFRRFSKFAVALWIGMIVSPLLLQILLKRRYGSNSGEIIQSMAGINPLLTLSICLLLFLFTLALSIRCQEDPRLQY